MDDLFKDLVFLGGTPIDSITTTLSSFECLSNQTESQRIIVNFCQNQTEFYTMEQFEYSLEPN